VDLNSQLNLKGELSIKKYSKDNKLIQQLDVPNLVVTAGKQYIATKVIGYTGSSSNVMSHMGVGTSATIPVIGNTALNNQIARVELDSSTVSGTIVTYSATFGPGVGTGSVVEAGIFNASSAGTMLCHTTFPVVNKDANETIVITWNISVG
jgi:hypothetical protein